MLSRAIKMTFWVLYDHIGKLMLANMIWAAAFFTPFLLGCAAFMTKDPALMLTLGAPLFLLAIGVVLPVTAVGIAYMAKQLIDSRDGSLRDFFAGVRLYWKRAVCIGLTFVFATATLLTSVWFYAVKFADTAPWLGYGISALAGWGLVFVALMSMLILPALVQKKDGVIATIKLTALLVADNPFFCLGLAIQFAVLAAFSLIAPVLAFLSCSTAMVLGSSAYEMLARKYAKRAQALASGSKMDARVAWEQEDAQDDYLNRGLRDFMFPWKG
jgi:hypothetical protein